MINQIFDICVDILIYSANLLGITYKEINVYIFCIIWPILTILETLFIFYLLRKLKSNQTH